MLDLVVPCCPMLFHFGMSPRMAAYRVLRGVLPPWAWQSATCVLRAPSVINLEPLHVHHVELDTSLRPRDHRYVLAVQKAWSFSTRFLILLFVFFKLFVFICLHGVKSANGPNEKDFRTCYLASITPWLRPWESCFKKIPSCLFSRVYCPKASKSSIQWATRVLMPVCVSRLSFFLLSLMSDRSGLGPGKYTDQLQSTACSNCPIGLLCRYVAWTHFYTNIFATLYTFLHFCKHQKSLGLWLLCKSKRIQIVRLLCGPRTGLSKCNACPAGRETVFEAGHQGLWIVCSKSWHRNYWDVIKYSFWSQQWRAQHKLRLYRKGRPKGVPTNDQEGCQVKVYRDLIFFPSPFEIATLWWALDPA